MAENTKIQWADHTFNPWIGCQKVAEGCRYCYAENLMDHRYGRVKWGPEGTRSRTKTWRDPVKWDREAEEKGVRYKVFCASLADVFEDRPELEPWRAELFDLIDDTPNLDWLLLTKRPQNIGRMWPDGGFRENAWLGTSIATQADADENIDLLCQSRDLSPCLFLSLEPQIGYVDLTGKLMFLDWVIQGGESKQGPYEPRPFDIRWAVDMAHQCAVADRPLFIKQLGSRVVSGGRPVELQDSHGGNMDEWPSSIRVRQCPEAFVPAGAAA